MLQNEYMFITGIEIITYSFPEYIYNITKYNNIFYYSIETETETIQEIDSEIEMQTESEIETEIIKETIFKNKKKVGYNNEVLDLNYLEKIDKIIKKEEVLAQKPKLVIFKK
jgi:hypothetical protein